MYSTAEYLRVTGAVYLRVTGAVRRLAAAPPAASGQPLLPLSRARPLNAHYPVTYPSLSCAAPSPWCSTLRAARNNHPHAQGLPRKRKVLFPPPPPGSPGLVGLAGLRCCVATEPRHVVDWPQGPPAWVLPRDASVQPQDRETKSESRYSAEDRGLFKRCRNDAGREKSLAGFPCAVHRGIRVYVGCTQVTNGFGVGHAGRGTRLWRRQRFLINCARSLICTLT